MEPFDAKSAAAGANDWADIPPVVRRAFASLGSSIQVLYQKEIQAGARLAEQRDHYQQALAAARGESAAVAESARGAEREAISLRARLTATEHEADRRARDAEARTAALESAVAAARQALASIKAESQSLTDAVTSLREATLGPSEPPSVERGPLTSHVKALIVAGAEVRTAISQLEAGAQARAQTMARMQEAGAGTLDVVAELAGRLAAVASAVSALDGSQHELLCSTQRRLEDQSAAIDRLTEALGTGADRRLAALEEQCRGRADARSSGADGAALAAAHAGGVSAALSITELLTTRISAAELAAMGAAAKAESAAITARAAEQAASDARERLASFQGAAEAAGERARAGESQATAAAREAVRRLDQRSGDALSLAGAAADKAAALATAASTIEARLARLEHELNEGMSAARRQLSAVEAGLEEGAARSVALAESVADVADAAAAGRAVLESTAAAVSQHNERLDHLATDLAERPPRLELECRWARHPTLDVMREFVTRQISLAAPEHEALGLRLTDRVKAAVLAALADGAAERSLGERTLEPMRVELATKGFASALESLRLHVDSLPTRQEVGLALSSKVCALD